MLNQARALIILGALSLLLTPAVNGQCSSAACLETATTLRLPSGPMTGLTVPGVAVTLDTYSLTDVSYSATFSGLTSAYDVQNQRYTAWCVDAHGDITLTTLSTPPYTPFASYNTAAMPANMQNANWDKINWVLNNRAGFSSWAVQQVLWKLLYGTFVQPDDYPTHFYPLPQPEADNLYSMALVQGAGFVPAAGQKVGVLLYVDGVYPTASNGQPNVYQEMIVEVPMPNCGKLGDVVWYDTNSNGIQDAGEPGIDGVTIRLLDSSGTLLQTTTTSTLMGQAGYYQFRNLACGPTYQVQVDTSSPPLAGKNPSPLNGTPNTALDSNLNPYTVIIPASGSDQTIDFGFYTPVVCTGEIGDFVFNDANANGIQDIGELGISGVKVLLTGPGGLSLSATTTGSGAYLFSGLCAGNYSVTVDSTTVPPNFLPSTVNAPESTTANDSNPKPSNVFLPTNASSDRTIDFGYHAPCDSAIGDFVWTDLNANGIQDANEPGINGVTLQLLDSSNNVIGNTTTMQLNGVNGSYLFSGLCAGTYKVVVTGGVPNGYTPSQPNAPGSTFANDSNGSPTTVSLPQSTTDRTVDFGYTPPCTGTIGDFIWFDLNANGIQDPGETAIAGVIVNLRKASDNSLLQTTTSNGGPGPNYLFTGLCTGDYKVEVVPPTGYIGSPTGAGTTATDSNPNPAPVTLPANNANDTTIDFGFYQPPSATCVAINAVQGAVFSVKLTGTGGSGGPYTFSKTAGPSWLNVAVDGTVSGTPTETGTFSYTVQIKDKDNNIGTFTCSVTVIAPPSASCVSINAIQGAAFSVKLTGTGGTGGPYTFSKTAGPAWLSVAADGTVSGTPTETGTFSYTVQIKDKDNNVGAFTCSVTVIAAPSANCVAINAVQGVAFSVKLTGTGGTGGPYTFSKTAGPSWLNVAADGTVSGTPTATGTFSYTVQIKDKDNNVGTFTCSVTVIAPPSASCVAINAVQGVAFSVKLTGAGGTGGPYTFSKTAGPSWLNVAADGTVSGTPTATGTFSYTVQIKDKDNNIGTLTCSVSVIVSPSASCVAINAVQGVAFSVKLTATGGTGGPYTFTKTAGPTWLTIAADGTVSGTPTATGTFSYTVQIKDKDNNVGSLTCSVSVSAPPPVCVPGTFTLTGNTATSGTAGIIRTFTANNGIQVKASAFSRNKSTGAWSTAYLGSYSAGLGVTDKTEGTGPDPLHKVDNVGQEINYVLFEFSAPVVVNRAFLNYVTGDSDVTVWVGTRTDPFNNHLALSDTLLASLAKEDNDTTLTTARWADINNGNLQGNVLVIAASTSDTSPDDQFKISQLETSCPQAASCTGKIGDFVWKDSNANGIQDSGEAGIGDVTVQLKTGGTVLKSTTTDSAGKYSFTGVCAGNYSVVIPTTPSGYNATTTGVGTNRAVDSNGNPAAVTLPTDSSTDLTIDFGFTPQTSACVVGTFTTTGNTSSTGTAGNIRTFTATNGVQVKVSAFSRTKSNGTWSTAYLGAYAPGLGVTDGSESGADPTHKVDNVGSRHNYVLFEFSSPVVINRAFLDSVGADSDMTVWIGTANNPFTNHLTLSDSLLTSLGTAEENLTTSPDARWANINAANEKGNVLVIAAWINDQTADDEFKISKLETSCP